MATQTTLGDTHRTPESTVERRCQIVSKEIVGKMVILFDPGNLRVHVERPDEPELELRLPGSALERAMLFDGKLASVRYHETLLDGETIDITVRIVNSGLPMDGADLVKAIDELTEGMSQAEREAWADSLDPKWRDDGGPEWRSCDAAIH